MEILEYIIGGLLALLAVVLIVLIGKQQGKRRGGLSNSIAGVGASESYLAKNKIGGRKESYQKWTLIVAIVFVVLVLALYIVGSIEPASDTSSDSSSSAESSTVESSDTSVESSDTSVEASDTSVEASDTSVEASEAPAESADTSVEASE